MFERDLQRKLERIFGLSKTTFLAPNHEAPEQDTLFITVERSVVRAGGNVALASARINGTLTVFSQGMLRETEVDDEENKGVRLPFGFFGKRIHQADASDTKHFFFESEQDVAGSPVRVQNLHERQVAFTYLYSAQYDPDRGELNQVNFTLEDQQ